MGKRRRRHHKTQHAEAPLHWKMGTAPSDPHDADATAAVAWVISVSGIVFAVCVIGYIVSEFNNGHVPSYLRSPRSHSANGRLG